MANFVWSQIVHKGGFHIQLYVKYVLYGLIKYVAWFSKGGKCGCFVIINKWRFWVQSTLHPIWLYMQYRSDANFNTLTKASFYDLSILPSVNSMLIIRRSLFSLQNQYIVFWWHWNEPNPTSFYLYFCSWIIRRWLDSNWGPLESEGTALPTEPQPLHLDVCIYHTYYITLAHWYKR